MAPTDEAAVELALPCVSLGERIDASPAWCNEYNEATCDKYYSVNIHGARQPCVWLDVGCHASDAVACGASAVVSANADGGGGTVALLILKLLFVILLIAAAVNRDWWLPFVQDKLGKAEKNGTSRRSKTGGGLRRSATDEDEEEQSGNLLHDGGEDAGLGDGGGPSLADATALSAEAAREAAVACAAAHALLASHSTEQPLPADNGGGSEQEATIPPVQEACLPTTQSPRLAAPPPVAAAVKKEDADHHDTAKEEQSSPAAIAITTPSENAVPALVARRSRDGDDSPELPSLSLRRSHAAFDEGDLLADVCMSPKSPHGQAPSAPSAPSDGTGKDQSSDDDDDGFNSRPSVAQQYMPSNKSLALSLD